MSHRILLIDDEDDILEFIRYNLTKAGYEVYTARNGAEGLQQAAAHRPHLILLDVMMPTMDGIETCRALRCDPALKETMVVFLGPRRRGATARRVRSRSRRLYFQADQAQTSDKPHPGDPQTGSRRQTGFAGHRPGTTSGNPQRRTYRTAPQGVRPARPARLLSRKTLLPGRDLLPHLGRQRGRRRPHDRRPRPQNPTKNRRRTHLDRKGYGVQIRKLTTDSPKFITKIPENLTIRN